MIEVLKKALAHFGYFNKSTKYNFEKAGVLVDKSLYIIFSVISTVILSVSCAFLSTNDIWWSGVIFGFVALIISALGHHYDMERSIKLVEDLKRDLELETSKVRENLKFIEKLGIEQEEVKVRLDDIHTQLVNSILVSISKTLELDTSTRVSIYFEDNNEFSILGRYSSNPKLSAVRTLSFPINRGALSKAWEQGEFFDDKCCPHSENKRKYQNYQKDNFGYGVRETNSLTMKSCEYIGLAVKAYDSNIGVILFESECRGLVIRHKENIIEQVNSFHSQLSNAIISGKTIDKEKRGNKNGVDEEFIASIQTSSEEVL